MKIMIVDDNSGMRRMWKDVLSSVTENVCEASDGLDALWQYQTEMPDLLLMDILMPGMNGIEAAKRIRQMNPFAKIVMITEYDEPELREGARKAGAIKYFLKENLPDIRAFIQVHNLFDAYYYSINSIILN